MITTSISGCFVRTKGKKLLHGLTLEYRPSVLRMVTFRLLYPSPCGVVIGALRNTLFFLMLSQAYLSIPLVFPDRYTFSPTSMGSYSNLAPAAFKMLKVASMISGPIPSPLAIVTFCIVLIFWSVQIKQELFIYFYIYILYN